MKASHTVVFVKEIPKCDFCGEQAQFDSRTILGSWAYLCNFHFGQYGGSLGLGKGQMLKQLKRKEA